MGLTHNCHCWWKSIDKSFTGEGIQEVFLMFIMASGLQMRGTVSLDRIADFSESFGSTEVKQKVKLFLDIYIHLDMLIIAWNLASFSSLFWPSLLSSCTFSATTGDWFQLCLTSPGKKKLSQDSLKLKLVNKQCGTTWWRPKQGLKGKWTLDFTCLEARNRHSSLNANVATSLLNVCCGYHVRKAFIQRICVSVLPIKRVYIFHINLRSQGMDSATWAVWGHFKCFFQLFDFPWASGWVDADWILVF